MEMEAPFHGLLTQYKMLKAKVNIQVLKVDSRLITLFKNFFRG